jgi:serine/threonine protein kinase
MLSAEASTRTHDGTSDVSGSLPGVGGMVAGRYRLTQVIGAGGMGTVYEAENVSTGRRCAVKFLGSGHGRSCSTARFEREARMLARLEHEHVIAVFDFGWFEEKTPFFVMEYLRGQTLRQVLEQSGPLAPQRALDLLKQACRGMAHAHAHGVVHRDLKPDNLMLTQYADGRPWLKILDFGVARQLESETLQLTPTGAGLGTAHYMSPEQARGESTVDARADVYALGAILYEALSGQRVHAGSSYNEILFQVITQSHVPLAEVLPDCPSSLSHLVEHCLRKDLEERPSDAGALLSLLEQVQLEPLAAPSEPSPSHSSPGLLWGRWGRGSWPLIAVGLAVLVLALGSMRVKLALSNPGRELGSPLSVAAAAPCPTTQSTASGAAPLDSGAKPPVVRESLATMGAPAPPPRAALRRPAPHASRPPSRTGQASSAAPVQRAAVAADAKPVDADLPFATINPYERP